MMKNKQVFLSVDRRSFDGALQVSIGDENGGYRIAGPKYDGFGKQLLRHAINERDIDELRRYLRQASAALRKARGTP